MLIAIVALFFVWQGSTLLEYEEKDGTLVSIPTTVGLSAGQHQFEQTPVTGVRSLQEIRNKGVVRQRYDYSCGSAALTTLLNFFLGLELDEQRVMNGLLTYGQKEKIIARRGFSLADMKRFVSALGYKSGGFRGEVSDLKELTQPAILRITYGDFQHFVVLRDIIGQRVFIADPAFGNLTLTIEEFTKLWDNILFIVYAAENQRFAGLEITEDDLNFISEDQADSLLNTVIPEYYHELDRMADHASGGRQYYRP